MKRIPFYCIAIVICFFTNYVRAQSPAAPDGSIGPVLKLGDMAPGFTAHNTLGKVVKLADFKGKYIFLDFWGSLCVPCRREHPHLLSVYHKYKNKNFALISVSTYDMPLNKARWLAAIARDKLTWTQLCDETGPGPHAKDEFYKYGISALPRNFLIDLQGKIIGMDLKGVALDNALTKVLDN